MKKNNSRDHATSIFESRRNMEGPTLLNGQMEFLLSTGISHTLVLYVSSLSSFLRRIRVRMDRWKDQTKLVLFPYFRDEAVYDLMWYFRNMFYN